MKRSSARRATSPPGCWPPLNDVTAVREPVADQDRSGPGSAGE
jgi:hypothetical protein